MLRKENILNKLRDSAKQVNRWQENNQDRLKEIIACKCGKNSTTTEWRHAKTEKHIDYLGWNFMI